MTRILHVIATLDRGGTEVSCLTLARALAHRGFDNAVMALRPGARGIETALAEVAGPPTVLPAMRVARLRAFRRYVRSLRPDAVIFHFFNIEHVLLGIVARSAGARRVVTKQGNPAPVSGQVGLRKKVQTILLLTRWFGFRLVSSSAWIEGSLRDCAPLPKNSAVIHNGCDVAEIAERAKIARKVRQDNDKVIGMVARLDSIKDHATLINAFAMLPTTIDGQRLTLRLIGDGLLRTELEDDVRIKGVADRVFFAGACADIPTELGRMDVFVLSTTRDEGFGVVLIEALAASVPVIASDVPATREVLAGGLGQLVPAGNPAALQTALLSALCTKTEVPSTTVVDKRYGADAMAAKYLDLLS